MYEYPLRLEDYIHKSFRCSDVGMNCQWSISGPTVDIILVGVKEHAKKIHGFDDFSPKILEQIKANIKDV